MSITKSFHQRCQLLSHAVALLLVAGAASAQESPADPNYQLRAGDTISMILFQEPDMTIQARIAIDGSVQFPLIGRIQTAGQSLQSLQDTLSERYNRDYFVNPQISLQIVEYSERRVRVRGRVGRPGFVLIPPEEEFTLLDAIAAAGDVAPNGNDKRVELHRARSNGETSVSVFDLSKMQGDQDLSSIQLWDNDVIVVPEKRF